jgi:hypothetical protein
LHEHGTVAEQVVLIRDGGALDINCGITMHQNAIERTQSRWMSGLPLLIQREKSSGKPEPRSLDLAQSRSFPVVDRHGMTSDEKLPADKEMGEKHPSMNEFRRMIEEYARDLRRIMQSLRKRLH